MTPRPLIPHSFYNVFMVEANSAAQFQRLKAAMEEKLEHPITAEELEGALIDLGTYRADDLLSIVKGLGFLLPPNPTKEIPLNARNLAERKNDAPPLPPAQLEDMCIYVNRFKIRNNICIYILFAFIPFMFSFGASISSGSWYPIGITFGAIIGACVARSYSGRYYRTIIFAPDQVTRLNPQNRVVSKVKKADISRILINVVTWSEDPYSSQIHIEFFCHSTQNLRDSGRCESWNLKNYFKFKPDAYLTGAKHIMEYVRKHWGVPIEIIRKPPRSWFMRGVK